MFISHSLTKPGRQRERGILSIVDLGMSLIRDAKAVLLDCRQDWLCTHICLRIYTFHNYPHVTTTTLRYHIGTMSIYYEQYTILSKSLFTYVVQGLRG